MDKIFFLRELAEKLKYYFWSIMSEINIEETKWNHILGISHADNFVIRSHTVKRLRRYRLGAFGFGRINPTYKIMNKYFKYTK